MRDPQVLEQIGEERRAEAPLPPLVDPLPICRNVVGGLVEDEELSWHDDVDGPIDGAAQTMTPNIISIVTHGLIKNGCKH